MVNLQTSLEGLQEKLQVLLKNYAALEKENQQLKTKLGQSTAQQDLMGNQLKDLETQLAAARVFDVFESDKLGQGKKSVAINFVFNAIDKTLTDTEIDAMMKKLVGQFEKNIQAEIRK